KEQVINSIPAIQPVANKDLTRMASGYGYRMDPFYHTFSFHQGMDFTADYGAEVYATGDGVVQNSMNDGWGYGNHVIINHGFGYTTLYGHLSRIVVRPGQAVKRGQLIGNVGSTGRSTGPHLHYEVRKNGNPLNPAFFYHNDLSDEQYRRMLEMSKRETKRFD
ncbi:MAG: M23 family metallopeptidase, partial [Candidatus Hydrogenedentes bacterium]|nr:M23 family metallopeptidase [Candidatus Hydrogenedentota bacterium]